MAQLIDGPPAPPRKPRVRGASAATLGVITALILFALAGLMVADRFGVFHGPVLLTAAGVAVILLGLGVVYSGLRGRSSGVLGTLAVIAIIVAAPVAVFNKPVWNVDGAWRAIGDETFVVGTRDAAASGYNLGIGDSTVDLTGVPLTGETLLVPVSVGVGELRILVPEGASVSAEVRAGVGDVTWRVDGETRRSSGVGIGTQRFSTADVAKGADAQLALSVDIGAGDIVIEEDK
ncbi:LiaF domain-containing protein [Cellulomonas timonensis]|uniref:LiaF domain-containing protein n=1 Tax=Cellulomonas timonensis TaxID=1689271 RepID=UPI000831F9B6|nr:LiaF domain-containing protein [Cellulomonas timonensis]